MARTLEAAADLTVQSAFRPVSQYRIADPTDRTAKSRSKSESEQGDVQHSRSDLAERELDEVTVKGWFSDPTWYGAIPASVFVLSIGAGLLAFVQFLILRS
jgi:hypothetical protein